jgi:hypothetical protein
MQPWLQNSGKNSASISKNTLYCGFKSYTFDSESSSEFRATEKVSLIRFQSVGQSVGPSVDQSIPAGTRHHSHSLLVSCLGETRGHDFIWLVWLQTGFALMTRFIDHIDRPHNFIVQFTVSLTLMCPQYILYCRRLVAASTADVPLLRVSRTSHGLIYHLLTAAAQNVRSSAGF